jgi:hypothetical protein
MSEDKKHKPGEIILTDAEQEQAPQPIAVEVIHPDPSVQPRYLEGDRVAVITQRGRRTELELLVTDYGAQMPPAMAVRDMVMVLLRYLFATIDDQAKLKAYAENVEVLLAAEQRLRMDQLHDKAAAAH